MDLMCLDLVLNMTVTKVTWDWIVAASRSFNREDLYPVKKAVSLDVFYDAQFKASSKGSKLD